MNYGIMELWLAQFHTNTQTDEMLFADLSSGNIWTGFGQAWDRIGTDFGSESREGALKCLQLQGLLLHLQRLWHLPH